MKFNVIKLQTGGAVNPSEQQTQDPTAQIQEMAKQIIDSVGPEAALLLAQTIVQMLQSAPAPQEQAPVAYRRSGGKLIPVTRK